MRLVIADESPLFVRGLSLLMPAISGRDVHVVAQTDDASAVAESVRRHRPDLVVVSLELPEPGGVRAIAAVRRADPEVAVVAMSASTSHSLDVTALSQGANGCVKKTDEPEEVVSALVAAADGWSVVPRAVLEALLPTAHHRSVTPRRLEPDEVALWRLVARGLTTAGIADRLHVSERTAKRLIAALLRRLRVSSRTEAAHLAGSVRLDGVDTARP